MNAAKEIAVSDLTWTLKLKNDIVLKRVSFNISFWI